MVALTELRGKRLVTYARVSTPKQAERGSHKTQIRNFSSFRKEIGIIVAKQFVDKGEHGWDLDRKEFKEMLDYIQRPDVDGLLVQHTDRFSRADPIETITIVRRIIRTDKIFWSIMEGEVKEDNLMDLLKNFIQFWKSASDNVDRIKKIKYGVARKREERGGAWGPEVKTLDLEEYIKYRKLGLKEKKFLTKEEIARIFDMSYTTLWRRLREIEIGIENKEILDEKTLFLWSELQEVERWIEILKKE
jgi:DNA invertase Pin-like site-specific DNA recombinase